MKEESSMSTEALQASLRLRSLSKKQRLFLNIFLGKNINIINNYEY